MPKWRMKLSSDLRNKLNLLLQSQYWPLSKLQELQIDKLNRLVTHAYNNIPYYKNVFDVRGIKPENIQTFSDLNRLPILKKKDLRKSLDQLVSTKCNINELYLNSTGGSTGVPVKVYQDKNYLSWSAVARIRSWKYFPGFDERELEAVLWGSVRDIGKDISFNRIINFIKKPDIILNTFDIDEKKINYFLLLYNILRPNLIRGYASSLFFLAQWIEKNSYNIHFPKAIVSSAETLLPSMRSKINKVFHAKIFDSYGCREVSQIGTECENNNGYHMAMENQIIELVNNGNGMSKILVTNLNNYCMPMIRYEVGDLAKSIVSEKCSCGRTLSRIDKLYGRVNENIILKNGKIINGEYFEFLFYENYSIEKFQVIYFKKSNILKIFLDSDFEDNHIKKYLCDIIGKHHDFNNIEIEFTNKFIKTPQGKFMFVWMEDK